MSHKILCDKCKEHLCKRLGDKKHDKKTLLKVLILNFFQGGAIFRNDNNKLALRMADFVPCDRLLQKTIIYCQGRDIIAWYFHHHNVVLQAAISKAT